MIKWTQLLVTNKDKWIIANFQYLSEVEILKETIYLSEDGSHQVGFDEVVLVSKYDIDRFLISLDLMTINE